MLAGPGRATPVRGRDTLPLMRRLLMLVLLTFVAWASLLDGVGLGLQALLAALGLA
jgi:hypothetical protein